MEWLRGPSGRHFGNPTVYDLFTVHPLEYL
jgi:hypothetical protein